MKTMKSRFMSGISVLCALMILIGIMPTGVFADSTETYKNGWIYFDISKIVNSNIPENKKSEWKNGPIYIYAWNNFNTKMNKITDTVYGIDVSTWSNTNDSGNLIFTTKNNWSEIDNNSYQRTQQVNYTIETAKNKIFSWNDNLVSQGNMKDAFDLRADTVEIGSQISGSGSGGGGGSGDTKRIYFDATLSKLDYVYDENSIYFDVSNIPNDKNGGAWKNEVYLRNYDNSEHWDKMNKITETLYEINIFKWENVGSRGSLVFATKDNWNAVNNGGYYVRTQQINNLTLESAKGKVFRWNGNDDYIDGKPQLGITYTSQSNFSAIGNGSTGVKCYANNNYYDMTKLGTYSTGENTWSDVYYVDLPNSVLKVRFLRKDTYVNDIGYGRGTIESSIPSNFENPCFYADSGDDLETWNGKERKGYWGELHTIRNSEQAKNIDIVDISKNSTFEAEKDNNAFYLKSTFYDYYSDYEINGNNRDNYKVNNGGSQRNWITFRQLDQALSDVYSKNNVSYPIYTGHFQPDGSNKDNKWEDWGCRFRWVANSLNLYGWNNGNSYNNFFSVNNSTVDGNGATPRYEYAVQGLVSNTHSEILKMTNGTINLPHFDKEFLNGKNSKNTKIGEVYEDVQFPFTKKDIFGEGIDYYWFDSAETSLVMHQDKNNNEYYLENVNESNKYKNVDSSSNSSGADGGGDKLSNVYGFFPFNETSTDTHANTYNYGFGTKIEFKFKLTEDGKIENKNGEKKPIKFLFSGDDDVWIYVDGNLALDVGGDHGMTSGVLDFSNKKAYVSDVKAGATNNVTYQNGRNVYNLNYNGTNLKFGQEKPFNVDLSSKEEHTLTFYYMERGMWESNMKIAFNLPDVRSIPDDESQLNITKEVNTSNVNDLFKEFVTSKEFDFSISNLATHYGTGTDKSKSGSNIEDYGSAASGNLELAVGANYISSVTSRDGTVDAKGEFKVKNNETITFNEQFRTDSYVSVNENLSDNDKRLFNTQWQINGSNTTNSGTALDDGRTYTITQEDRDDGKQKDNSYDGRKPNTNTLLLNGTTPTKVSATCINTVNTGSISLKKTSVDGKLKDKEFTFNIKFSNIGGTNLEREQSVKLKSDGNGTTITGIPVGTRYTITEDASVGSALNKVTCNDKEISTSNVSGEISENEDEYNYLFENRVTEYGVNIQKFGVSSDTIDINWNTADTLSGATFRISNSNGTVLRFIDNGNGSYEYSTSGQRVTDVTTGNNGILNITKLPVGTYELQETKSPIGYIKNVTIYKFTILDDGKISVSPASDKMVTVDENTIKVANRENKISIQKFGILSDATNIDWNNATKLAGAEFTIKNSNNTAVKFINKSNGNYEYSISGTVDTITTSKNGILNITKLPAGTYKLQETKAPAGYVINNTEYTFTISDIGEISVSTADDKMITVDENTIKVANRAKPLIILPGTGGSGVVSKLFNFALFGVITIGLSGGVWLLVNKKFKLRKGEGIK